MQYEHIVGDLMIDIEHNYLFPTGEEEEDGVETVENVNDGLDADASLGDHEDDDDELLDEEEIDEEEVEEEEDEDDEEDVPLDALYKDYNPVSLFILCFLLFISM